MARESPRSNVSIREVATNQAQLLLERASALQGSLYPPESIHVVDGNTLDSPGNVFFGAFRDGAGDGASPLGCVGLLITGQEPGTAEIKSLFVPEEFRRHGIASALMDTAEAAARERGITLLRLETGIYQPESLALYRGRGYVTVPPFGHYTDDPVSVFMAKQLG